MKLWSFNWCYIMYKNCFFYTFASLIYCMGDYWDHRPQKETAVLVGVITQNQTEEMAGEYLEELAFLADTAGAEQRAVFAAQQAVRCIIPRQIDQCPWLAPGTAAVLGTREHRAAAGRGGEFQRPSLL